MSTDFKSNTISITPLQHKILEWMTGKGALTETEALAQGLGRMGISRQAVRNGLHVLSESGLVKRKKSTRIINNGFGLAAATGRKIKVIEYVVNQ